MRESVLFVNEKIMTDTGVIDLIHNELSSINANHITRHPL